MSSLFGKIASMNTENSLGMEVSRLLRTKGQTQEWLAEAVAMRQASISRIIKGKQKPSERTIEKIADALQVDAWHLKALLGYKVPTRQWHPSIHYIAERMEALPPEVQEEAIEAVGGVVDALYNVTASRAALADCDDGPQEEEEEAEGLPPQVAQDLAELMERVSIEELRANASLREKVLAAVEHYRLYAPRFYAQLERNGFLERLNAIPNNG
jgi:transcriptional regulator with XRE-family HTH domain